MRSLENIDLSYFSGHYLSTFLIKKHFYNDLFLLRKLKKWAS